MTEKKTQLFAEFCLNFLFDQHAIPTTNITRTKPYQANTRTNIMLYYGIMEKNKRAQIWYSATKNLIT